jgi:hypothetical protein
MKVNPRLQINIKDNVVNKEDNQANESFNKMANMLREVIFCLITRPGLFINTVNY